MSCTSVLPKLEALVSRYPWLELVQSVAVLALAIFLLGSVFRLFFGKGSALNCAVSASLSVFLIYLAAVLIEVFLPPLRAALPPLPFVRVDQYRLALCDILHLSSDSFYPAVLRLSILAVLVNCLEEFMPKGEKFLRWYLWRTVTVLVSLTAYVLICGIVQRYVPQIFGNWARYLICGFWLTILMTGLLKVLLGLVLTVMNPIVGGLYALFFSNLIGKQISKSILTTLLVMLVWILLYQGGLNQFAFSGFSLAAYGPSCLIIVVALYFFGKFL